MPENFLIVHDFSLPQILVSEKDFLIVFKPPRMHSAPQAGSHGETLFGWCYTQFPGIAALPGRRAGEGGLLHRLDYETQGLMLIARNKPGMDALLEQQRNGKIIKEYSAISVESKVSLSGFPNERPELPQGFLEGKRTTGESFRIKSAFRPYGQGRIVVRPVIFDPAGGESRTEKKRRKEIALDGEKQKPYVTEIFEGRSPGSGFVSMRIRIFKGFRHQIRSHLAWLGLPIVNDSLYGGSSFGDGLLALRACSLSFCDPSTERERRYSIQPLAMV